MEDIFGSLVEGPLPNILVVGGLLFFFLSCVGKFGANIIVDPRKQKYAGILGSILLFVGIALHLMPILAWPSRSVSTKARSYPPPQELTEKVWQFSHGDGSVIAERIRLLPDQRIEGYYHPNESRWGIEEGILVFYHESGEPSCRFTAASTEDGRTVLSGPLLFDPDVTHVLREVE